ncbi:hypothetical protein KI688_007945 [Linnemannia hyalina]|uniref:F-box domain-containing protein n=1 Tax=Linnemannia hyalina TaxID=64524 RepID=A0A9P7XGU8_9FUNG|nr:hypothetical protein KI688_007945 [Linnemannia hyalina]
MTVKKILSRRSLGKQEDKDYRRQRSIRMKSLPDEDAGVVFWEDFCDLHDWPKTPTTANIHRYIEVFVNDEEKKINRRRGLTKGDKGYLSGHDLFIKPVLRFKARLLTAQNAAANPAVVVHASPPPKKPSDGNGQADDTPWVSTSSNNNSNNNDNNKRPMSASKESQPDIFAIAEIAWLVSRFLDAVDLGRLCQTSKGLQNVFHSILWYHYVFTEDDCLTEALDRNMAYLRSLDLEVGLSDPELFKVFGRCDSLTRLHVCADDDDLDDFCDDRNKKKYLHPLISTIGRQHHLTQLELNTLLVWRYPETFLPAFLALQQLQLLRVYMSVKGPTIPTALQMVMDLLNKHPRLEAILFGDWCCSEDSDDERSYYSDEDHSHFSDGDEDEDEIGNQEMDTFNELERQLRADGYPMITKLELPPRQYRPYPATFLEPLFRSGLPNLRSLRLPRAETTTARDLGLVIRSGCPKLQHFTFSPGTDNCDAFPEIYNVLENCNALSSISVTCASMLNKRYFCPHADTLTVLILPSFKTISSAILHQVLLRCSALKVLRLEKGFSGYATAYKDIDFKTGRWSCAGLEVLWLFDCVFFGPRRVGSPSQGYKDYTESRRHFWTQVGHLSKLQELVIGSTKAASTSDVYWTKELRLGGPIKKGQDEKDDSRAAEENPGLLHLLRGLRNLRVLRVRTDKWPRWVLPDQAEVEFMELNWPCLREFSYVNSHHGANGWLLENEPQWKWLKLRRPGLVVKGCHRCRIHKNIMDDNAGHDLLIEASHVPELACSVTFGNDLSINTLFWVQGSGSGLKDSSTKLECFEFPGWIGLESIKAYVSRVRRCLLNDESRRVLDESLPQDALDMLFDKFVDRYRPAIVPVRENRGAQRSWLMEDTHQGHGRQARCMGAQDHQRRCFRREHTLEVDSVNASLVECAFGRIKIVNHHAVTVVGEHFVFKTVENYFTATDPGFQTALKELMDRTDAATQGNIFERYMMTVFSETFKSRRLSD